MKRYLIIGTDTSAGKTYVTGQLARYLTNHHHRVQAIKPIASGCIEMDSMLVSEDAMLLNRFNAEPLDERLFWRFKQPVSPHIAAAEEGVLISAQSIAKVCESVEYEQLDYQLIESAGGLMSPFSADETWIDFLIQTKIPVILVVGIRLGCINHALLTDVVLNQYQIPCVGWIANVIDPNMLALQENIQTLTVRLSCPLLAEVSFSGTIDQLLMEY